MADTPVTPPAGSGLNAQELAALQTYANANASKLPNGQTPEDFVKSYQEMHSAYTNITQTIASQSKKAEEPEKKEVTPPSTLQIPPKTDEPKVETSKIDRAAIEKDILERGELSDETIAAHVKSGITKDDLSIVAEGVKSRQATLVAKATEMVGGPEELASLIEWCTKNLDESEKQTVNASLVNGSSFETTVRGLNARRLAGNTSKEPTRPGGVVSTPTNNSGDSPFTSAQEERAAFRDPKYKTDPTYREQVQRRLNLSFTNGVKNY